MSEQFENEAAASAAKEDVIASDETARWYVAHTYSGYENKVKSDIEKTVENRKLQEQILEVTVPVQEVIETTKTGAKKTVLRKLFPGYVLVHMYMNDVTWYVVRNTRGVTGFVGPESKPVPLTEREMRAMGIYTEEPVEKIDVAVGDTIQVVTGAWEGNVAVVKMINESKRTVTIDIDIFGRATSVEIGFEDIQKM